MVRGLLSCGRSSCGLTWTLGAWAPYLWLVDLVGLDIWNLPRQGVKSGGPWTTREVSRREFLKSNIPANPEQTTCVHLYVYSFIYISGLYICTFMYNIVHPNVIGGFHVWGFACLLNFISNPTNICSAFPVAADAGMCMAETVCGLMGVFPAGVEHSGLCFLVPALNSLNKRHPCPGLFSATLFLHSYVSSAISLFKMTSNVAAS